MSDVDFLRFVLPEDGVYVGLLICSNTKQIKQRFFTDVEDLYTFAVDGSARGLNAYFACASYLDDTSRRQENVSLIKSFFLDVDCGEGKEFADQREGAAALVQLCKKHRLPKPTIVSSGNGFHVYWVLDEAISYVQWRGYARKLKALSPNFDPAVTADAARVLRVPGTTNTKGGKPVRVIAQGQSTSLSKFAEALGAPAAPSQAAAPPPKTKSSASLNKQMLEAMSSDSGLPPADSALILESCANLRWATENQDKVSEPLWYATLGVAAYCENPEDTAIAWSSQYENYDEGETRRKVTQWKDNATGPTTCAKLRDLNETKCEGCPFAEKLTSPAQLGIRSVEVAADDTAPDTTAKTVPVPKQFKRTERGFVIIEENKLEFLVCDFDIYPVSYGYDELLKYEVCRFRWKRPHVGWQDITLRLALLAPSQSHKDLSTALADKGIVLNSSKQMGLFQVLLRGYLHELRKMQTMTNLFSTMGWKEDYTQFALGNRIMRKDKDGAIGVSEIKYAGANGRIAETLYGTKGDAAQFARLTLALEKADLPIHNWMFMVGMSSVLYAFGGLNGLVINLYGKTGGGKTLAQYCQQAVWGDPIKLHFASGFTGNALYQRLGLYNNLPFTIDEATVIPQKEIGDFLYCVSQGREKARLDRNAEAKEVHTWSLPVTTSANKAMGSMLTSAGMVAEAQLSRLLDIKLPVHPLLYEGSKTGKGLYRIVTNCYGHIGPKFMEYILTVGVDAVRQMLKDHEDRFNKQYDIKFGGSERFWEQAIVTADFCGMIAAEQGWILCDYRKSTEAVLRAVGVFRENIDEVRVDCFDILGEYFNDNVADTIVVNHMQSTKMSNHDPHMSPRNGIYIRFDIYQDAPNMKAKCGTVSIDRKHLRSWIGANNHDYRGLISDLIQEGVLRDSKAQKVSMGKNTKYRIPQVYALKFSLKHPKLANLITNARDNRNRAAIERLKEDSGADA